MPYSSRDALIVITTTEPTDRIEKAECGNYKGFKEMVLKQLKKNKKSKYIFGNKTKKNK